ncbi:GNAT family N-acetyltransferase [Sulfurovum sp. CS9]|uniref:GNAT family N-acetyltransferase n=1 Tax=Sulfurovum sp. CS9 TaxID=3391146 RepID=UPI0039E7DC30
MIHFIKVHSEQQIADVTYLAREIWQEHYVSIVGQQQIDYMLEKFQCEQAIAKQLTNGYEYYSVTYNGRSIGYMAATSNMSDTSLMISKIYVRKSDRSCGLGKQMLEFVEELCRQRRIKKIWLTVNKNNRHSIEWYSRMGFINNGPIVQDIGGGFVMDDFKMEKVIGSQTPTIDVLKASHEE